MSTPPISTLPISTETITLAQALKLTTVVGLGSDAKHLIRSGGVRVNGTLELQPGRKLRVGDKISVAGGQAWTLVGQGPDGTDQASKT